MQSNCMSDLCDRSLVSWFLPNMHIEGNSGREKVTDGVLNNKLGLK